MMKRILVVLTLLALLVCLTACNFTQRLTGALEENAESPVMVDGMMSALAAKNTSDAKDRMHPQVRDSADGAIAQMVSYLAGRSVVSKEVVSINVNTSVGTAGKVLTEQLGYRVTLTDGDVIYLSVTYLSDRDGDGFTSFQLVLGVV